MAVTNFVDTLEALCSSNKYSYVYTNITLLMFHLYQLYTLSNPKFIQWQKHSNNVSWKKRYCHAICLCISVKWRNLDRKENWVSTFKGQEGEHNILKSNGWTLLVVLKRDECKQTNVLRVADISSTKCVASRPHISTIDTVTLERV